MMDTQKAKTGTRILSASYVHIGLLVVGALFLLINAFHGSIWFDESYSVAIAKYSFADIWRIGSSDVHPVLFYWALHVLYTVFGESFVVYRLFTIAGAVALAMLGLTHIRKDFGWRVGLLFTFLALFSPYISIMAVEIRMYSWATFTVMVCAIYAYRIFVTHRAGLVKAGGCLGREGATADGRADSGKTLNEESHGTGTEGAGAAKAKGAEGGRSDKMKVPFGWWILFFVSSIASAYLHYYAMLAVFSINIMLFVYLLVRSKAGKGDLVRFTVLAVVQIALYLPWLMVLIGQLSVVSNTYWAKFYFPISIIELVSYPIVTSQLSFALQGSYGPGVQILAITLVALLCIVIVSVIVWLRRDAFRRRSLQGKQSLVRRCMAWATSEQNLPFFLALCVYVSVFVLAGIAAVASGSSTLYYRYMFLTIGPLLFFTAGIIARVGSRVIVTAFCVVYLALTLLNQSLLVSDSYSPENEAPLTYFAERVDTVDMIVSSDIGFEGVTAVMYPDITQYYLDWQKGNWGVAYQAYGPNLISVKMWEEIIPTFRGRLMLIGTTMNGALPRAVNDFETRFGATVVETKTFFRPYERLYYTVAILEKN